MTKKAVIWEVILYDDYFDIVFNASEDNTQNIKLENIEDYTNLENALNNKKNNPNTLVRIALIWCRRLARRVKKTTRACCF